MAIARHVAIIMDRNGEWAKKRSLSRVMGHREGVRAIRRIIMASIEAKIEVLSLFAFSTENWCRPKDEVNFLMTLLEEFIKKEGSEFIKQGIKLVISGRMDRIPEKVANAVNGVVKKSIKNQKMVLNIALDYGGRDEIVRAAKRMAVLAQENNLELDTVSEYEFASFFDQPELPPVDLLIRSGGEQRISNFMLWQVAYAELFFTPVLWPDFSDVELKSAMAAFEQRNRRFGKTDEQIYSE